ncbi:hypothetical protein AU252_10105 [Pseudarthrobacter sulfonivorans]|uniref:HTH tetR-type domain-containing protein n=1 Tax=Pseudarthrobacter sulfonivorans TaxID=121292 RepID=A0A0U2XC25_9MICC|nr:TetR/AcrR family transcriptional regulator [Pseudarthrobacter sulfonivorans]ALV41458.1 hypothetical protein AU252_10105 [Pseudarthrobacter sulfonivorans]
MSEIRHTRGPYKSGLMRRKQILAKASEVFATYGYGAGSLRQIAVEVGVTPAALMRHFESKEDLLVEVLRYWGEQSPKPDGDAAGVEYFEGLRSVMRYNANHRGFLELFLTLSTEASNPGHPAGNFIRERNAQTLERFTWHLASAVQRGEVIRMDSIEISAECRTLISVMDGLELQWLLDPSVELVSLFDRHLDLTIVRWTASGDKGPCSPLAKEVASAPE